MTIDNGDELSVSSASRAEQVLVCDMCADTLTSSARYLDATIGRKVSNTILPIAPARTVIEGDIGEFAFGGVCERRIKRILAQRIVAVGTAAHEAADRAADRT